jgi:hypothetical protein
MAVRHIKHGETVLDELQANDYDVGRLKWKAPKEYRSNTSAANEYDVAVVGGAGGFISAFHEGGDHVAVYTGSLAGELIGDDTQSLRENNSEWKRRYGYEILPNVAFAEVIDDFEPEECDKVMSALTGENAPSSLTELASVLKLAYRFGRLRVGVGGDVPLSLTDYAPGHLVDRVWEAFVEVTPPAIQASDYRIDPAAEC